MRLGKVSLLIFFLVFQACNIQPWESKELDYTHLVFTAKVIRILDGDTMEVLYRHQPIKIRLAHIDCPEKRRSQPYGNNAKKALSDLCFGQMVNVQGQKYDRYKRLIAVVVNGNKQVVNQEMIKLGMAWHFKRYSSDPLYAQLEIIARKNKVGLWQEADAVAPWAWRETKHSLAK
ncbi:endonuclease YncB(thermonuclease family) [Pedobacter sp. AK013]|uniref:thermonuclease family protein n=1 Tax=Pedobacter sp. AK013 TaxID=2723071 RepID=UPI00160CDAD6|nr:thermonuclease family protein [Pedobacter sp. AK013]MBB6236939.1 endonuclease YncB(thermonuclease family) [Pedobacter sp. AK013]